MLYLGLLDRKDPPHLLIPKAVELLEGEDELISRWELSTEIIKYVKEFFYEGSCWYERRCGQ